jgi:hypothetical protein
VARPGWLAAYRFKYGIADAEARRRLRDFESDSEIKEVARMDYARRWTSRCTYCGQVIDNDATSTQRLQAAGSRCPVEPKGFHRWESGYQGGAGK